MDAQVQRAYLLNLVNQLSDFTRKSGRYSATDWENVMNGASGAVADDSGGELDSDVREDVKRAMNAARPAGELGTWEVAEDGNVTKEDPA